MNSKSLIESYQLLPSKGRCLFHYTRQAVVTFSLSGPTENVTLDEYLLQCATTGSPLYDYQTYTFDNLVSRPASPPLRHSATETADKPAISLAGKGANISF